MIISPSAKAFGVVMVSLDENRRFCKAKRDYAVYSIDLPIWCRCQRKKSLKQLVGRRPKDNINRQGLFFEEKTTSESAFFKELKKALKQMNKY